LITNYYNYKIILVPELRAAAEEGFTTKSTKSTKKKRERANHGLH